MKISKEVSAAKRGYKSVTQVEVDAPNFEGQMKEKNLSLNKSSFSVGHS